MTYFTISHSDPRHSFPPDFYTGVRVGEGGVAYPHFDESIDVAHRFHTLSDAIAGVDAIQLLWPGQEGLNVRAWETHAEEEGCPACGGGPCDEDR